MAQQYSVSFSGKLTITENSVPSDLGKPLQFQEKHRAKGVATGFLSELQQGVLVFPGGPSCALGMSIQSDIYVQVEYRDFVNQYAPVGGTLSLTNSGDGTSIGTTTLKTPTVVGQTSIKVQTAQGLFSPSGGVAWIGTDKFRYMSISIYPNDSQLVGIPASGNLSLKQAHNLNDTVSPDGSFAIGYSTALTGNALTGDVIYVDTGINGVWEPNLVDTVVNDNGVEVLGLKYVFLRVGTGGNYSFQTGRLTGTWKLLQNAKIIAMEGVPIGALRVSNRENKEGNIEICVTGL